MKVGIVGCGINGIMCAWSLLDRGFEVTVFERAEPVGATSRASTKLLHGGLRYLEHGDFAMVREGLRARTWWLQQAPAHTRSIEIAVPVFPGSRRGRWKLKAGLMLYDFLGGGTTGRRHRWVNPQRLAERAPQFRADGLEGAYIFEDGQMDDHALGQWALDRIVEKGALVLEHCPVVCVDTGGGVVTSRGRTQFDAVLNVCGPWASQLLDDSGIAARHRLELARGSHLLIHGRIGSGFLLESPDDGRPCFVLPYGDHTLVGTTEVRQQADEPIACSEDERAYLTRLYNRYFEPELSTENIVATFAGVRPLVASSGRSLNRTTRESAIERSGRLVSIFGGKWTTSRELGQRVSAVVGEMLVSSRK